MNVMLWKPGVDDGTTGELPHIGLGILAADIAAAGHGAVLLDRHFDPGGPEPNAVLDNGVELLCVSLVSQEWPLDEVQQTLDRAHRVGIPVWLGGPHAHAYGDLLEDDPRLTKIIIGEADGCFDALLESPGRTITLGRREGFGRPDFTRMLGHEKLKNYPFFTSRGCTHNCTFCAGTKTHGNRWRPRPVGDALWDELDQVAVQFPAVSRISIIDDAFTADLDHAKSFLEEYLRRGYPHALNVFNVRADQLDRELLDLLRRGRVEQLAVGIESGDPEVFRRVGKGERLETIREAIGMIQQAGITPWLNMVIGLPGDSPEAHRRSMEWVDSIPGPRIVQWLHYAPYRGTWAHRFFVERGDITDDFIPWLQGGRYEELPEMGVFDAAGFSRHEKMVAQLEAYLSCLTPILALNEETVAKICNEEGLMEEYARWKANAPIEEFLKTTLPQKVAKGQSRPCTPPPTA